MNCSCMSESYNKIGSLNNWFRWLPLLSPGAGVWRHLTRQGALRGDAFLFSHLPGCLAGLEVFSSVGSVSRGGWVSVSRDCPLWSRARRPNGGPSSKLPSTQLYIDVGSHPFQMDLVDIGLDKPARLRLQIQIQQRCLVRPAQLVRLPWYWCWCHLVWERLQVPSWHYPWSLLISTSKW